MSPSRKLSLKSSKQPFSTFKRSVLTPLLLAVAAVGSLAQDTEAAAMFTYTVDGGPQSLVSGSLNGVPFSSATYKVTATADGATAQSGSITEGTFTLPTYGLLVTPILTLSTAGTVFAEVTLLPSSTGLPWAFASIDLSSIQAGMANDGFGIYNNPESGFGVIRPGSINNLQTPASYSGYAGATNTSTVGESYRTSGGLLNVTRDVTEPIRQPGGSLSITAVPEPSSFALLGFAAAGLLVRRKR
jgi:hypothetical protein